MSIPNTKEKEEAKVKKRLDTAKSAEPLDIPVLDEIVAALEIPATVVPDTDPLGYPVPHEKGLVFSSEGDILPVGTLYRPTGHKGSSFRKIAHDMWEEVPD